MGVGAYTDMGTYTEMGAYTGGHLRCCTYSDLLDTASLAICFPAYKTLAGFVMSVDSTSFFPRSIPDRISSTNCISPEGMIGWINTSKLSLSQVLNLRSLRSWVSMKDLQMLDRSDSFGLACVADRSSFANGTVRSAGSSLEYT